MISHFSPPSPSPFPPPTQTDCINDDAKWTQAVAVKEKSGKYSYTIDTPGENLYSAFFIEVKYFFFFFNFFSLSFLNSCLMTL